ncbi:hypothetical protein PV326_001865 [Microctonus aethiopoides]|nr:hypothetical protein PV326_001865 [Microctonus aethiopoides]
MGFRIVHVDDRRDTFNCTTANVLVLGIEVTSSVDCTGPGDEMWLRNIETTRKPSDDLLNLVESLAELCRLEVMEEMQWYFHFEDFSFGNIKKMKNGI